MGNVFVAEDKNLRPRKTAAINDRSVIELIRDDEVVLAQKRRNRSRVRREARLKHHASLDVFKARDFLLQLHVYFHGARDRAHRARPDAILARRFQRRFPQFGMSGEAQVIVRGKIDNPLAIESAHRRLLVIQHAQREVRALSPKFVQLVSQKRKRIGASGSRHGKPRIKIRP